MELVERSMMAAPLVTVVMPCWNSADYVAEAIGSILSQTLEDFELLAIDDGSTDATLEVVRSFADPRLRILRNPVNLGVAAARNLALAVARGRFIAMMDSDDIAVPHRLATQIELLLSRPEIDVCGADADIFGAARAQATDVPSGDAEIKAMFLSARAYLVNPTCVVRRSLIDRQALRFRSDLVVTSDYAFWVACMRAGARFANVKQKLVRYRWHGRNMSRPSSVLRTSVDVTRAAVIGMFFPLLNGEEVDSLCRLFTGTGLNFEALCAGVTAARRALGHTRSRFGESRPLLERLLEQRIRSAQKSVEKQMKEAPR